MTEFVYANGFAPTSGEGILIIVKTSDNKLDTAVEVGTKPRAIAITQDEGLGEGDPDEPERSSSGNKNSCALAGPGAASTYLPLILFIPALVIARRLLRGS